MSRLLDVLLAGGEVALRLDDGAVVASALLTDADGIVAEGSGSRDITAALDSLESALAGPEMRRRLIGRKS